MKKQKSGPQKGATPARPLDDDRRARILQAALSEFSAKGFAGASTNAIAEQAEVAKGLLFHYFKNKEDLFLAVADDVFDRLLPAFEQTMASAPRDLFARVMVWTDVKLRLMRDDPRRLRFIVLGLGDVPDELKLRFRRRVESRLFAQLPRLLDDVDASRLRPGVTKESVVDALHALSIGFERTALPLLAAARKRDAVLGELISRARGLFSILKTGAYEDEEKHRR